MAANEPTGKYSWRVPGGFTEAWNREALLAAFLVAYWQDHITVTWGN
jgi:hypothetical protein